MAKIRNRNPGDGAQRNVESNIEQHSDPPPPRAEIKGLRTGEAYRALQGKFVTVRRYR
jgi:hypothetical protein